MSERYDAVIVGASLAGSTAASFLGRQGARVALAERSPDPNDYKRACTHFIQAHATPTLERLGLAERIEAAGGIRNSGQFYTRWGTIRPELDESYRHSRYGYNIRREALDPMVRQLAAETPVVDLLLGHAVDELVEEGDGRVKGVRAATRRLPRRADCVDHRRRRRSRLASRGACRCRGEGEPTRALRL